MLLGVAAAFAPGCATVANSSFRDGVGRQEVTFSSDPSGADVVIVNARTGLAVQQGRTPLTVVLPTSGGYFRRARYEVTLDRMGFQRRKVAFDSHFSGWYVGNLIFGLLSPIGFLVDPATGAMWTIDFDELRVNLAPAAAPPREEPSVPELPPAPAAPVPEVAGPR